MYPRPISARPLPSGDPRPELAPLPRPFVRRPSVRPSVSLCSVTSTGIGCVTGGPSSISSPQLILFGETQLHRFGIRLIFSKRAELYVNCVADTPSLASSLLICLQVNVTSQWEWPSWPEKVDLYEKIPGLCALELLPSVQAFFATFSLSI